MRAPKRWLPALMLAAVSCASHPDPALAPQPPRDPRVISEFELRDPVILTMDALRAIRRLRPGFFRANGPQSFLDGAAGQVHYSMDYGPVRPVSELVTLTTAMLVEIRFLDANDAQNRFGLNANGGPVIVLLNNKVP